MSYAALAAIQASHLVQGLAPAGSFGVQELAAGSSATAVFGIAYPDGNVAQGAQANVVTLNGVVTGVSDGTTTIAVNDPVKPSTTVAGRLMKANSDDPDIIGTATAACAATPGATFTFYFVRNGVGANSNVRSNLIGTVSVPTENFLIVVRRATLTGTQQLTLAGTATLKVM